MFAKLIKILMRIRNLVTLLLLFVLRYYQDYIVIFSISRLIIGPRGKFYLSSSLLLKSFENVL